VFLSLETVVSLLEIARTEPAASRKTNGKEKEIPRPSKSQSEENPRVWIIYELVYSLQAGSAGLFDTGQGQDPLVGLPAEPVNSFSVNVMKP
jgi:hypothetical protein